MRTIDSGGLLKVTDGFSRAEVVVVGDLMVDHYIFGKVDRISQEAPVVVVEQTEESKRPGGAGNVVRNLVSLGARVLVCGVVGDDDSGRRLLAMLEELGADTSGVLIDRSRPTTIKTRVIAHAQQVVRVDRETRETIAPTFQQGISACMRARFPSASGIIVSDYAKGAICSAVFNTIEEGYNEGFLGLGRIPVLVDPKGPNFSVYKRATVIKPNRGEAAAASGIAIRSRADAVAAGRKLLECWNTEMVLITMGEQGMVLVSADDPDGAIEVDTTAREVYDVSGAGDTASAAFLLALAAGGSPTQAAALANIAAGIVVGEVGTAAVTADELRQAIKQMEQV